MPRVVASLLLGAACALLAGGCSPLLDAPSRFVYLEHDDHAATYDYRAASADGVVVAVRILEEDTDHGGDLPFWTDAVTREVRNRRGYALLETVDITTDRGLHGKQLRFGHDQRGKPYRYWLSVFVGDDRLYLIEAGGPVEAFDAHADSIHASMKTLRDSESFWSF